MKLWVLWHCAHLSIANLKYGHITHIFTLIMWFCAGISRMQSLVKATWFKIWNSQRLCIGALKQNLLIFSEMAKFIGAIIHYICSQFCVAHTCTFMNWLLNWKHIYDGKTNLQLVCLWIPMFPRQRIILKSRMIYFSSQQHHKCRPLVDRRKRLSTNKRTCVTHLWRQPLWP